jgi:hypothetical protein
MNHNQENPVTDKIVRHPIRDWLFWSFTPTAWLLWKLSKFRFVAAAFKCKLYRCRLSVAFSDKDGMFSMPMEEFAEKLADPTKNFHLTTNSLRDAVEWCKKGVEEFPEAKCATIAYFDIRRGSYDQTCSSQVWRNENGLQFSEGLEERLGLPITPRKSAILERE